ncbi:MAG: hypothetical protein ACTSSL_12475 [Candidatus Heimdallarchaeaceae archaeon]
MNQASKTITLIHYQCNYCQKRRKLIIPKLLIKSNKEGALTQYIDIHRCINDEFSSIICFIDNNLVVRSQARVKATHAGYEPDRDLTEKNNGENPFVLFNIPLPQSKTFVEKVVKTFLSTFQKIEGLTIKDRLRNTIFKIAKQEGDKQIHVISRLGFVEVDLYLKKKTAQEVYNQWRKKKEKEKIRTFPYDDVRRWIQELANELESVVTLDEEIMPYIADYLDINITTKPDEMSLLKQALILNMTISLPISNEEQIQNYIKYIETSYQKMDSNDILDVKKQRTILELCLNNITKTIKDIYIDQNSVDNFADFIEIISFLSENNFLTVYKLKFEDY